MTQGCRREVACAEFMNGWMHTDSALNGLLCVGRGFMGFVTRSRNTRNRVDGAKELKKLVYFSNIVVSPLLEDLKVCLQAAPSTRAPSDELLAAGALGDSVDCWAKA